MKIYNILILALFLAACNQVVEEAETANGATQNQEASSILSPLESRVIQAEERLNQNEAGAKVWRAIESHGGLEKWYGNGLLQFHFDYQPEPGQSGLRRNTLSLNNYWSSQSTHTIQGEEGLQFGFDGQRAWSTTGEKVGGINPRFWSLTPYYFVGLPFVLADEGVVFESLPDAQMGDMSYQLVKASYESGTGDAPDDYYILYLNPETGQLDALRYIVSYPGFFEPGQHSPEKLMRLTGKTTVDGMVLPTAYETSMWQDGSPSPVVTRIDVSDYAFLTEDNSGALNMPEGAQEYIGL
ncbi:MAG: hypothetical protein AAFP08_11380 [Bacteroidota bacterium]